MFPCVVDPAWRLKRPPKKPPLLRRFPSKSDEIPLKSPPVNPPPLLLLAVFGTVAN